MSSIGSTPALIVGVAAGGAASAAFEPALEVPKQDAWASAAHRLPGIDLIARLVASGQVTHADAVGMAQRLGFSPQWFDSFLYLSQTTPGFPAVLRMWRLAAVDPAFDDAKLSALMDHALAHEGLDWDYQPYLRALKLAELPGIGDIAYAVVRGYLPTDIPLPVAPPSTSTNVKRFPQGTVKAETLAAAIGYDQSMLELMIARAGLSMAPGLAAQARFRNILEDDDYHLAIAEGDLRTEWADSLLEVSRAIPSPGEYAELWLRGWLTQKQAEDGAARHGMKPPDTDLLYQLKRRPLSPHQIKQALARGATFDTTNAPFDDPYKSSVHEANLGPEWYDMAISLQGAYASIFVTNRLVTGGTITPDIGRTWLEKGGYADEVVTALHDSWTAPSGAAADKDVASAATKLKTRAHASYVGEMIDGAAATTALGAAGVAAAAVPQILKLWDAERALIRKQLTPTQIRKAVSGAVVNPATGAPWSHADAVTALLARGYDQADAETFLAE